MAGYDLREDPTHQVGDREDAQGVVVSIGNKQSVNMRGGNLANAVLQRGVHARNNGRRFDLSNEKGRVGFEWEELTSICTERTSLKKSMMGSLRLEARGLAAKSFRSEPEVQASKFLSS